MMLRALVLLQFVAVAYAGNCAAPAATITFGADGTAANKFCATASPLTAASPPARCGYACDAAANYVGKTADTTWNAGGVNVNTDVLLDNSKEGMQQGGVATCLSGSRRTDVWTLPTCVGAHVRTLAFGVEAGVGKVVANQAAYTTACKMMVECGILAAIDSTFCVLGSQTQVVYRSGVSLTGCVGGTVANNALPVTACKLRVAGSIMTKAQLDTKIAALDSLAKAHTAFDAALTAMKAAAGQTSSVSTQVVSTATAITSGALITELDRLVALNEASTFDTANGVTDSAPKTPCSFTAPTNGNLGSGALACSTEVAAGAKCQFACDNGYAVKGNNVGAQVTSAANAVASSQAAASATGAYTAWAAGTGGFNVCPDDATGTASSTATCVAGYSYTHAITVATSGTGSIANQAAYDTNNNKAVQITYECTYAKAIAGGTGCAAGAGANTAKYANGLSISSAYSSGVITFTVTLAYDLNTDEATTKAKVAGLTAAQMTTAYGLVTTEGHTSFDAAAITTAAMTAIGAPVITAGGCAVTAPTNGAIGDCPAYLAGGKLCTPTCSTGYTLAANITCSNVGALTPANNVTCTKAPAPPASSAKSNTTATKGSTGAKTQVKQKVEYATLTVAQYTGDTKSAIECSYLQCLKADFCTAAASGVTVKTGIEIASTASARRKATVEFTTKVPVATMTKASLKTAVASGVTAAALQAKFAAVKATWTAATGIVDPGTATPALASYSDIAATGASAGAGAVVPSLVASVVAGALSLM